METQVDFVTLDWVSYQVVVDSAKGAPFPCGFPICESLNKNAESLEVESARNYQ